MVANDDAELPDDGPPRPTNDRRTIVHEPEKEDRSPRSRLVRLRAAADPRRPLVQWLALLGIVVGIVGGIAGVFNSGADQPDSDAGNATPRPAIRDFLRTDGTLPQRAPVEGGLLTYYLNAPLSLAESILGDEDARYSIEIQSRGGVDEPGTFYGWDRDSVSFSVVVDKAGAIRSIAATTYGARDTARLRLSLPRGLTLGQSTMGEVVRSLGDPTACDQRTAENDVYYSLIYLSGPEGTHRETYTYIVDLGHDPGYFNSSLYRSKVTAYEVDLAAATLPGEPSGPEDLVPCFPE